MTGAGDMPNFAVDQNGRGTLDYTLKGGDIAGLLDTDGAAASFTLRRTIRRLIQQAIAVDASLAAFSRLVRTQVTT